MIRVGVVGYGSMGQMHSQALQQIEAAELVVVADPDPDRRAQAARDYGVEAVANPEELLALEEVDLIDICVPTYLHEAVFNTAVAAKKHIFCEKPLARSLQEGQRMRKLAQDYEGKIGIGHVVRFFPAYQAIRQSVLQGEVGTAAVARTFRGGGAYPRGWHDWFSDFDLSGGVILDLAIHDIDFLRWLFGDVQRVYAKSTYGRTAARLQWAVLILRFQSGLIAHVESGWSNVPGEFRTSVEIGGERGLISYDSSKTKPILRTGAGDQTGQAAVVVPESPVLQSPYLLELEDMISAIKEDRQPLVSVEDALGSLQVALAALESCQSGAVVSL